MDATAVEQDPLVLAHHFRALLSAIEPPSDRVEVASEVPAAVRRHLASLPDFPTREPHSRLVGSYARHTAIHGIKDVDILVFVEVVGLIPDPEETLESLFGALAGLPEVLRLHGAVSVRRRQRRSVHVEFEHPDICLDVVPALTPTGLDASLLVPDREWGTWICSHPLGYAQALSELNRATNEQAVPLMKLVKHWRTVQMIRGRPKSYWVESLVYQQLCTGLVRRAAAPWALLFTDLLRSVQNELRPHFLVGGVPAISDPMLGGNVAFNWLQPDFARFMARLDDSIAWAEAALATNPDAIDEAVVLWQRVFGAHWFPASPALRTRELAERAASGTIHVAPTGTVLIAPAAGTRAVVSPPHRFHGDAS